MSLTATDIAAIIGNTANKQELHDLLQADAAAVKLLKSGHGVLITDTTDHHDTFERVALACEPSTEALDKLERLDKLWTDNAVDVCATDEACNHWTPRIEAAYYIGLALGLRLAKGGAR